MTAGDTQATRPGDRDDPFARFVDAQASVYADACAELAAGAKRTHWMWFVFPQLRGLGRSATAQFYGIGSAAEARRYWEHPVLGPRLKHCAALLLAVRGRSARDIFGDPDDLKLRSCMTLFAEVVPEEPVFAEVLGRYFDGHGDAITRRWLDVGRSDAACGSSVD